jgi:hypothetical protein
MRCETARGLRPRWSLAGRGVLVGCVALALGAIGACSVRPTDDGVQDGRTVRGARPRSFACQQSHGVAPVINGVPRGELPAGQQAARVAAIAQAESAAAAERLAQSELRGPVHAVELPRSEWAGSGQRPAWSDPATLAAFAAVPSIERARGGGPGPRTARSRTRATLRD